MLDEDKALQVNISYFYVGENTLQVNVFYFVARMPFR